MIVQIQNSNPDFKYEFQTSDTGIVGIYGVSGSGKSSLLNAIAGYTDSVKGRVEFSGDTLFDTNNKQKVRPYQCGYMPQHSLLFPHWTIRENLDFVEKYNPNPKIELKELLDVLDCHGLLDKYPNQISGGEKQRIALIRALLQTGHQSLLLLDEPFSALSSELRKIALNLLKQYKENNLILLVTHDIVEIYKVADQLLLVKDNRIHYQSDIESAFSCGKHSLPVASRVKINNKEHILFADYVSISLEKIPNSSITHQLPAEIKSINPYGRDFIVELRTLDNFPQLIRSQLTEKSVAKLKLEIEKKVLVNFKATSYNRF